MTVTPGSVFGTIYFSLAHPLNCCSEAGVSDRPSEDLLLVTEPATVSLARVPAVLPSTSST